MFRLIRPHYQRKSFFRPRQPLEVWPMLRRHQLVELFALSGVIVLVWLGAHIDNQRTPWMQPDPAALEAASVELMIEVPAGVRL